MPVCRKLLRQPRKGEVNDVEEVIHVESKRTTIIIDTLI
jgi:hypothetical protein